MAMTANFEDNHRPSMSLRTLLSEAFTAHPAEAGENYWEHLGFTIGMAWQLLACCFVMVVHGFLPFLFTHSASTRFKTCQDSIMARRNAQGMNDGIAQDLTAHGIQAVDASVANDAACAAAKTQSA